ncbi:MAG: hypothetical protein ACM3JD_14205, partial [Rudaea sp.]
GVDFPTGDLRGLLLEDGVTECWPTSMSPNIGLVAVDKAMGRQEIWGAINDAYTALPIKGALATAFTSPGNIKKGYGGKLDNLGDPYFFLVNVPRGTDYNVRIAMTGYTASPQIIAGTGSTFEPWSWGSNAGQVSLPPNRPNNVFVTDWDALTNSTDLDNYLWLPPQGATGNCVIGYGAYLGTTGCGGVGTLLQFPMARWMRDGGPWDIGSEATSIKTLYDTTLGGGPYRFYVKDSSPGDGTGFPGGKPIVRLWRAGVIVRTVYSEEATDAQGLFCVQSGGAAECPLWYVGDLNSAGGFTYENKYTNAPPYTIATGTITTQKKKP